jgi:hypothetical protein
MGMFFIGTKIKLFGLFTFLALKTEGSSKNHFPKSTSVFKVFLDMNYLKIFFTSNRA